MHPEAIEHLYRQNIEALDTLYSSLLTLAQQGAPEAKEKLREVAAMRAKITGDTTYLARQQKEIDEIVTS